MHKYFLFALFVTVPFFSYGSHLHDAYIEKGDRDGDLFVVHSQPRVILEMYKSERNKSKKKSLEVMLEVYFNSAIDLFEGHIEVCQDRIDEAQKALKKEPKGEDSSDLEETIITNTSLIKTYTDRLELLKVIADEYLSEL